jgi:hypothetical protein
MIPKRLQSYFQDVDINQLDQETHTDFIIKRLLERGSTSDILWLKQKYTKKKFRHVLQTYRDLSRKTGMFWAALLNMQPSEVKCLQTPYRAIPFGV